MLIAPMHWLRLGALAGLGACFPMGLTAQILRPNAKAIIVSGDGSLWLVADNAVTGVIDEPLPPRGESRTLLPRLTS